MIITTENQLHPDMIRTAKQCGFYPYLFNAVRPRGDQYSDYLAFLNFCFDSVNMTIPSEMTAGEVALVGSHRTALASIASDPDLHDDDWSIILESDARLHPNASYNARTLVETAIEQQNDSASGFMYLGACLPTCKHSNTSIGGFCHGYCTHALAFTKRRAQTFFRELYCTDNGDERPCGWMCKSQSCIIDQMMNRFFAQSSAPPALVGYDLVSPDDDGHRGLMYQCCRTQSVQRKGTSLKSINFHQSGRSPHCFRAEFTGRLGNLMFEYATLVGACLKHGQQPDKCAGFSAKDLSRDEAAKPTKMFQGLFKIPNVPCLVNSSMEYQEHADSIYAIRYDPNVLKQPLGTIFRGYLQSFKYFDHAKDVIRRFYAFPDDVIMRTNKFLANIRRRSSAAPEWEVACISVRRGDKTRMNDESFYDKWSLSTDYYKKALNLLHQQDRGMIFVYLVGGGTTPEMIEEDRQWVLDTFINPHPDEYAFLEPEEFEAASSLHMMTQCDHLVVSSSSFSWWAGYLSTKARTIIAPKVIQADFVPEDYYPPAWTLVYDE